MVGRRVGSASSPLNCFREVLLFPFWFCVIFSLVWKLTLEVNTLPWFLQALSFLTHWHVEKQPESWTERRGAALFSSKERVDWKESTAATSPAAHWLFARSLCPGISSPGEPASLLSLNVLEHWNDYQVAHLIEKEMATHSSILAWRIPGTGEPGGQLSMGSHRVEHNWSDLAAAAAAHLRGLQEPQGEWTRQGRD